MIPKIVFVINSLTFFTYLRISTMHVIHAELRLV